MKFGSDLWPVASFFLNILLLLIGGLAIRWVAGIVKGVEQQITIAVQRVELKLAEEYVTAGELAAAKVDLQREINLGGRLEAGLANVRMDIKRLRSDGRSPDTLT